MPQVTATGAPICSQRLSSASGVASPPSRIARSVGGNCRGERALSTRSSIRGTSETRLIVPLSRVRATRSGSKRSNRTTVVP